MIFAAWPPQKTGLEPSERKIDALGAFAAPTLNPKAPHSTNVTASVINWCTVYTIYSEVAIQAGTLELSVPKLTFRSSTLLASEAPESYARIVTKLSYTYNQPI